VNLRSVAIVAGGAFIVLASFGIVSNFRKPPEIVAEPPALIAKPQVGIDAAQALADVEKTIAHLSARVKTPAGDMIDREELASAFLGRSRLSGDWADLVEAGRQAEAGFTSVPGHGPLLARATVSLAAHRLTKAEADLGRIDKFVVPDNQTKADAAALHGDIALLRGDFAGARAWYGKANAVEKWPGLYSRIGNLALMQGDYEKASLYYRAADGLNRHPSPSFRADSLLRQGELALAQGQWPEATKLFTEANRVFPGWWRAEMRVAQMLALNGNAPAAISAFEGIATRVKAPEAMDILAGLYRNAGNAERARHWAAEAGKGWQKRLAMLPEASWGHAVEHELASGTPARALELALLNASNRPYPPSQILLAKAWIASGKPEPALTLLAKAEATGFVSADMFLTRAEALAMKGDGAGVAEARERAAEINPRALERNPSFAWLDH
jgi:tetratricopeptide (TPR) repeat protein